ncbi:uncharacterized protein LOC128887846 isoform X2 [Hylaeus anthracinus]|uniref:uncharacterized protein LOC128873105 isoform X2 n=1 Tax=Hylaeus volcanicus TaxID=313075 RepID=UPI0023B87DE4|nr:uncharacterized protein LOC128873105 isoform X2 [Hylaeus volcanicus]XP_054000209.1 uncharacterized protein LOC128887846 isoform X2 [Hylaeus anthracinus]
MVEVQQLRDPLEGETDCNPYPTTTSPLLAGFDGFRISTERCRNRSNRKLKGDVVLEKVSKDKVAKKTKLKTVKPRTAVPYMGKGSIAAKVWETFAAVRKTRVPRDIIETASIVALDHVKVSPCCENLNDSALYDESNSLSEVYDLVKNIIALDKESGLFQIHLYSRFFIRDVNSGILRYRY